MYINTVTKVEDRELDRSNVCDLHGHIGKSEGGKLCHWHVDSASSAHSLARKKKEVEAVCDVYFQSNESNF